MQLRGIPTSIILDRDRIFLSHFWKEIFKLQGTVLKRSTTYHPQTDGQSEVANRCLETHLRCFSSEKPCQWLSRLPWAEFWYNTTHHSALGCSPFKALYGCDTPPLLRTSLGSTMVSLVEQQLLERDATLDDLRMHLLRAQQRMKKYANNKRHDDEFLVGDKVFLKLRLYRHKSLVSGCNQKLAARFYGPYTVLQRIGVMAYKLDLPTTAVIHPVFHISQLRRAKGTFYSSSSPPPQIYEELELIVEPDSLLDVRKHQDGALGQLEVLIQWKNLPPFEATWEDYALLNSHTFHLEDKVHAWEGRIDKPLIRFTYTRRKTT